MNSDCKPVEIYTSATDKTETIMANVTATPFCNSIVIWPKSDITIDFKCECGEFHRQLKIEEGDGQRGVIICPECHASFHVNPVLKITY